MDLTVRIPAFAPFAVALPGCVYVFLTLHASAPYRHDAIANENFNFFGKTISGLEQRAPRWKQSAEVIDGTIGEDLGQLYVEKYFPQEARARMNELVGNVKDVFRDRLQKVDWMSDTTRQKALDKLDHFTQKIGYPEHFREYSSVDIRPDDYLGNIHRADAFEIARRDARVGQAVDKTEWGMTPPTVNAYYNPLANEIAFPAGILQPPFFDVTMDDPINYGAIGAVIGHEMTHGFDDQGRLFGPDGNLQDWWTEKDAGEFNARSQKLINQYDKYEPLPGTHVNGKLTLGENIADLGGLSIAYNAMEQALAKDPDRRVTIDGYTPEQRFFLSYAQSFRDNIREAEAKRLVTTDPHAPGRFRVIGTVTNMPQFYEAFGVKPGDPMWLDPSLRTRVW